MTLPVSEALYAAMRQHDTVFDGHLYVGIVSTGIVCFPSCRSRLPKRENVRVFSTFQVAVQAGFRPCKRCKPDSPRRLSPDAEVVRQVEAILVEQMPQPITLQGLADALHLSPYHLLRVYKRLTGVSPARRLQQLRMHQAKQLLTKEDLLIETIAKQIGLRSASHFSTVFQRETGLTPSAFRHTQRATTR